MRRRHRTGDYNNGSPMRHPRRQFLTVSATTLGGLLVYTLDRRPDRVHAQSGRVKVPLRFFTELEALAIAAAAARIFPADESGPGANEAGVVIYIDRQLASAYGRDQYRYTQPPFEEGVPEQGYQGKETPREIYRAGLKKLGRFHLLSPAEQDTRLKQIENSMFFSLLRTHTVEGMFSDPMHGGNANLIGWQLIGFPGPRMSYFDDIDRHYGVPFRPKPASLAQILGRPARSSEDKDL
jgi:gluconate 2-dehydrogenase gamma chain